MPASQEQVNGDSIASSPIDSNTNADQGKTTEFVAWLKAAAQELEQLGDQSASASGVVRLPLSAERENGQREVVTRLFPAPRAYEIRSEFYERLKAASIELAVDFEMQFSGRLETARQVALACLYLTKWLTRHVMGRNSNLPTESMQFSNLGFGLAIDDSKSELVAIEKPVIPMTETEPASSSLSLNENIGSKKVSGFLGGADLANALGIHQTRRDAFFRQLERRRKSLGDGYWHEVQDPRPKNPRFLYSADSVEIQTLAKKYKEPRAT